MDWQPIDSAPMDGTPILGYAGGECAVVRYRMLGNYWSLCVCGAWAEDSEWTPTLWQPLPPMPTLTPALP
jgi:hypothetical protein